MSLYYVILNNRSYDRLAAGQGCRRTRSAHLAGSHGHCVLRDSERDKDAADVEVSVPSHLVSLHAGIAVEAAAKAVSIGQATQVSEGLTSVVGKRESRQLLIT